MPKLIQKKSEKIYATAKAKDKSYRISDGDGLAMIVKPSGRKIWQVDFMFEGNRKTMTLGQFKPNSGQHISLSTARTERDRIKYSVSQGENPVREHQKPSNDIKTFETVAREWLDRQQWVEGHKKRVIGSLQKDVFPNIGNKDITDVTRDDVRNITDQIESRGAYDVAKRICQRIDNIFDYAIDDLAIVEESPVKGLSKRILTPQRKHRPFLREQQIAEFLNKLNEYSGKSYIRIGLKIMMRTFVRPGELRLAQWTEFDLDKAEWHVPSDRMKMRRDHVLPLSNQVIQLLKELREVTRNSVHLFPSITNASKPTSDVTFLKALKIMGYVEDKKIVPHGFRHTASTILHEKIKDHGFDTLHIEMQLAHVDKNKVRGVYNHALYLEERRDMMQWYSDYLDELRSQDGTGKVD